VQESTHQQHGDSGAANPADYGNHLKGSGDADGGKHQGHRTTRE
jgi:hypothetical protein